MARLRKTDATLREQLAVLKVEVDRLGERLTRAINERDLAQKATQDFVYEFLSRALKQRDGLEALAVLLARRVAAGCTRPGSLAPLPPERAGR